MLKKENRLKKRKEFNYIYKKGTLAHSNLFTMHFVKAYKPYPQIGITVSKTVGNSVVRSRVKRIISEACRLNIEKFAVKNYVITAKENVKDKTSKDVELELLRVLKKNNLIKEFKDNENLPTKEFVNTIKNNKNSQRSKQSASNGTEEQTN